MSSININGITYTGKNVSVSGNKVLIDEKEVTPKDTLKVNIIVEGNVDTLDIDVAKKIAVEGTVGSVITTSGDVNIKGNVTGGVKTTSGTVKSGDINGDVKTTSGTIKSGKISGSVKTVSGSIKRI